MANRLLCALALIVVLGVAVEGAGKVTCGKDKKPNLAALLPKFMKCAPHIKSEPKACQCILQTISTPIDFTKSLNYLKSVLPDKAKAAADKDLGSCTSKVKACKDSKTDKDAKTCAEAGTCLMSYMNTKVCK